MMNIRPVTNEFAVSAQLQPSDVARLSEQGFKTVIINRPDGEEVYQPSASLIEAAAQASGITAHFIPVRPGQITEEQVDAFRAALRDSSAKTLAYCRSGMRSISLWALANAGEMSTDAILRTAERAGYDLSSLRPRLDALPGPKA
jgi:sulfide:quinone oxidoreductase